MSALVTAQAAQGWLGDTSPPLQQLTPLIVPASQLVADCLGYDPLSQTWTELLSGRNTNELMPRRAPITAVTSVTINPALTSGQSVRLWGGTPTPFTVPESELIFTEDTVIDATGRPFPLGNRNITLVYTAGYPVASMHPTIATATLIALKALLTGQSADPNVASEQFSGVLGRSYWPTGPGSLPPAARSMLESFPYKVRLRAG